MSPPSSSDGGARSGAFERDCAQGGGSSGSSGSGGLSASGGSSIARTSLAEEGAVRALGVLAERIGDLEDVIAELGEEVGKLRKQVADLKTVVARKKQIKKLKKVLDQLDVIEVGAEDGSASGQDPRQASAADTASACKGPAEPPRSKGQ